MKSFSHWLETKPGLRQQIQDAIATYQQPLGGALGRARGGQRQPFTVIIQTLGDLWQRALFAYKAEVVNRTYERLKSEAAQRALTVEWDRLLHANSYLSFQNLEQMTEDLDRFAKRYRCKEGEFVLWDEFTMTSPEDGDGFIPIIGEGFSKSYKMVQDTCIPYSGPTVLEPKSRQEFEQGSPGSAWIGLLSVRARTGLPQNVAFLVPALHMEKHVTAPHEAPGISKPVEQWASSGHQEGVVRLITEGRLNLGQAGYQPRTATMHRLDSPPRIDPREAAGTGAIMGFAMVKAYDAVGHQWAFTSMTCNVSAAGGMQLPTDWAVGIWSVTKDLAGNIRFAPGAPNRPWVKPQPMPTPPPPPPVTGGKI